MNRFPNIVRRLAGIALFVLLADAAWAEVVPVVARTSPITHLSTSQLADIFLVKLRQLPDGQAVTPVDGPAGSPERDAFYQRYLNRTPAQMRAYWSKLLFTGQGFPPREAVSYSALKAILQADPSAIGYLDSSELDDSVRQVEIRQ